MHLYGALLTALHISNLLPRRQDFTCGLSQKSQGERSGLEGGCGPEYEIPPNKTSPLQNGKRVHYHGVI